MAHLPLSAWMATVHHHPNPLVARAPSSHTALMFNVSEAETAAIRAAFDQGGEWAAAVELRRLFPGVTDNAEARECAWTIAAWRPLQLPLVRQSMRPPRGS